MQANKKEPFKCKGFRTSPLDINHSFCMEKTKDKTKNILESKISGKISQ